MYKYLINGKEVGNIVAPEWGDDLESYANDFSFSTYDLYEVGSLFQILTKQNKVVIKGIITDFEQSETNNFKYSGFDCGFYINQNEIIEQFKKIPISDAIKKLCENYQIPVGNIPEMSATVSEIYKDKKLSDVLNELIKLAKTKGCIKDVYSTCARGKFEILPYETITDLKGYMAEIFSISSEKTIFNPSISVSFQELKNRVVIADSSDKNHKRVTVEDATSIQKYGLLQMVETVDTSKTNNLTQLAQNTLTESNKLTKTYNGSMIGDYRMHKGVIMPINDDVFGVKGSFLIKSSRHSISGNQELVSVTLSKRD